MEVVETLLQQSGLGLVAGVFIFMYITERKDHKSTQEKLANAMEARRMDTVETSREVTDVLNSNATAMRILSEKISVGKSNGGV